MNITIGKPCAISEKGNRKNNEDFIYPSPEFVNPNNHLFLVCDGVGGSQKGEVASSLASELFQTYFDAFLEKKDPDADFINKAIKYTEAHFDNYVSQHPEATGMATTLTMTYIGKEGVVCAHLGDSRIYHFRDGRILYRTEDHSLVNSWVKMGKLSSEEAGNHPQKNIILRAIQGTSSSVEADVTVIRDVEPGDYFFMCTDGVLENYTDRELAAIFAPGRSSELIKDILMEGCVDKTRDNYSFYIIPIQNVYDHAGIRQNILSFFYSLV